MGWEQELERLAAELRAKEVGPYVSLLAVAEELGLQAVLRFSEDRNLHAYVDIDKSGGTVVLLRSGPSGSIKRLRRSDECLLAPRERFSLAHEIGHYLAATRLGVDPAPVASSEYWCHERAIDAFAGSLLVPDALARSWITAVPTEDPIHPLALRDFSRSAKVSDEVVARALCRVRVDIGFLKLRRVLRRADKAPVLRVAFGSASGRMRVPNIHSHVKEPDLLKAIASCDVGQRTLLGNSVVPTPPGHTLRMAWRSVENSERAGTYWLAFALSRAAQLQLEFSGERR